MYILRLISWILSNNNIHDNIVCTCVLVLRLSGFNVSFQVWPCNGGFYKVSHIDIGPVGITGGTSPKDVKVQLLTQQTHETECLMQNMFVVHSTGWDIFLNILGSTRIGPVGIIVIRLHPGKSELQETREIHAQFGDQGGDHKFPNVQNMIPNMTQIWSKYDPHDLNMTQVRPKYDPSMTQIWPKHDPNMTQLWPKYDPNVTQTWPKYDPNMTQIWFKCEPSMTQVWPKYDTNMTQIY